MSNELEPGCLAVVIKSSTGLSLNRVVQCIEFIQNHPNYGGVWRVRSDSPFSFKSGNPWYTAYAPPSWIRKIKPGELDCLKKDAGLKLLDKIKE